MNINYKHITYGKDLQTLPPSTRGGMPLKRDELGGGTNSDGSKSLMYCSHCFQDGAFTRTNITAQEMQAFCIEKMVEMKIPRLFARFFARTVPHLERWKN